MNANFMFVIIRIWSERAKQKLFLCCNLHGSMVLPLTLSSLGVKYLMLLERSCYLKKKRKGILVDIHGMLVFMVGVGEM